MKEIFNLPTAHLIPFSEIEEKRRTLLVTSTPAWNAVKAGIHLNPLISSRSLKQRPITGTRCWPERTVRDAQVVYSVGGGLTADAAKYLSAKLDLPLTVMPTALSVDAFITAASGIRRDGCVVYIPTKVPENIILDFDVIAAAPAAIRAAGITDVMSIATGCWDWKFAHEKGKESRGHAVHPLGVRQRPDHPQRRDRLRRSGRSRRPGWIENPLRLPGNGSATVQPGRSRPAWKRAANIILPTASRTTRDMGFPMATWSDRGL